MTREQFEWRLENAKGAIKFAESGLRSLILVNGAAATVLLNFYSSFQGDAVARHALHGGLMAFGHGVLAAVVSSVCAYLYQRFIATTDSDKKADPFLYVGLVAAFASAGEFANGLYLAGAALQ